MLEWGSAALSLVDEALLASQALILMGDFNQPNICWRDNTLEHKQSWGFLECVSNNFLREEIEGPARRGAMLDPVLANREELVGNAMLQDSLGCSDHEMVELEILRAVNRAHGKLTALDFWKADFGLFKDLLCRVPQDRALEGREAQECLLNLKNHPSKLRSNASQQGRNWAKLPGSLHGWIRNS